MRHWRQFRNLNGHIIMDFKRYAHSSSNNNNNNKVTTLKEAVSAVSLIVWKNT